MPSFVPIAPKIVAQARRLYEKDRLPAAEIAARVGVHASTVLRYAKTQRWIGADASPSVNPRTRTKPAKTASRPEAEKHAPAASSDPPRAARIADAVSRAVAAAEKQLEDIEQRLGGAPRDATARERDARAFAIVSRALRDLASIDVAAPDDPAQEEDAHDSGAHSIAALAADYRARLARILGEDAGEGRSDERPADGDAAAADDGAGGELGLPRAP